MPNLVPPIVTLAQALSYKKRILAALPDGSNFKPLMTLYLSEKTEQKDLSKGHASGVIKAAKLYPAGATTNSDSGVKDFYKLQPLLEHMAEIGLPMCVHGEVTDPNVDIFDREAVFIDRILDPLRRRVPDLKVVMEHITTKEGAEYAKSAPGKLAATITTHHLIINRNHILSGGLRPHYYCLPVPKREKHRLALLKAATSGSGCYFLGTDSAPHTDSVKETACGCAGIFSATNTVSCLAEIFDAADALDKLENFTSLSGPKFYGLAPNVDKIHLTKGAPISFPKFIRTHLGPVTVFDPGIDLHWRVSD
jgi:dihydroorotase